MKHFFVLLLITGFVLAGTTGKISGIVQNENGDPVVGASILVVGTSYGSMTNSNGEYFIHNLQPGDYDLQARMVGTGSQTAEGVVVISDMTTRIDFLLSEDATGHTVINVTDQRGLIVFDETASVHVIRREDIETMPVSTLQDLTSRQAGVLFAGGGLHIRGGRTGEVLYLVDGIPVMDPLTNLFTMNLPLSSISEITIMSGGFSAEYGNAQSGIVNIITREGGDSYSGEINATGGTYSIIGDERVNLIDYTQWEDQIYRGDVLKSEVAIGGPEPLTSFILPAIGINTPGNTSLFISADWERSGHDHLDSRGYWDNNLLDNLTVNTKLTSRLSQGTRIMLSGYYSTAERGWRDWYWSRINEHDIDDGDTLHYAKAEEQALPTRILENLNVIASLTQTLSNDMFFELKYGFYKTIEKYRIESGDGGWIGDGFTPEDWEEYNPEIPALDPDGFIRSGEHQWLRHDAESRVHTIRLDITNQAGSHHQLKGGFEGRYFISSESNVYRYDSEVDLSSSEAAEPRMNCFYVQDRIEYIAGLIVNAGLRLDSFDPNRDWTEVKSHISPRLGISHPITDRDIIRTSYGHYYQIPNLTLLYWGSSVNQSSGSIDPLYGNPNLDAEETVSYELGIKHQFDEFTLLDITGFYKHITGLVSTQFHETTGEYWQFVNGEGTGTVRGAEVTFIRRMNRFWGINLNYTYAIAKGPRSSPTEEITYYYQYNITPNDEVYLDWDQRHMANASLELLMPQGEGPSIGNYHFLEGTGLSITWNFGSGIPYSNSGHGTHAWFRNQKRYPFRMNTNLTASREFRAGDLGLRAYCTIFNLFNRRNIDRIYSAEWYDADMNGDGSPDHDPTGPLGNQAAWSPARHFLFGLEFTW